jgi:amidase
VNPEQAIKEAQARDRAGANGALIGVPFNVKDIIDTSDMPTEYGSPIYAGHRPRADAACVAISRKAGAVLLGKAVTTEFANFHPSRTRNPLDLNARPEDHRVVRPRRWLTSWPRSLSALRPAARPCDPAAYCGVFGFRPTYGDLRCVGIKESAGSLDTLGLIARTIDDIALYRDALLDTTPQPIVDLARPPRVGFCRTHLWPLLEPTTQTIFEDAAGRLARAGAEVADVDLSKEFDDIPRRIA